GGTFLLNCPWDVEELSHRLPGKVKRFIAQNDIKFYVIDGISIGKELGLGTRINTILQAAFFKLSNIIPVDDAVEFMKAAAKKSYGKKGDAVVQMNYNAIDRGIVDVKEVTVPEEWANAEDNEHDVTPVVTEGRKEIVDFVNNILTPVNAQKGDSLPVSTFVENADGTFPNGSAAYEKRGIAVDVPEWNPQNCIQCNFCSFVCPHAVIRPVAMTAEEAAAA
ncbi:MAG: 2-oxoacid:acceptor oxidoreductase family protein, partial [Akkermansia muciniphila]